MHHAITQNMVFFVIWSNWNITTTLTLVSLELQICRESSPRLHQIVEVDSRAGARPMIKPQPHFEIATNFSITRCQYYWRHQQVISQLICLSKRRQNVVKSKFEYPVHALPSAIGQSRWPCISRHSDGSVHGLE